MKEEVYNIIKQVQEGQLSIGDAQNQLLRLFDVMPSLPQSETCPSCQAYDWSYHYGIDKMKCGDCGYEV